MVCPTQEQINSLVSQVCGKAVVKKGAVLEACNGGSPVKPGPKRGPRKRATVEVSLSRISPAHLAKSSATAAAMS